MYVTQPYAPAGPEFSGLLTWVIWGFVGLDTRMYLYLDPPKRLKYLLVGEKQFFAVRRPTFSFSSAFSENCTKHRQSHGSDDAFCRTKRFFPAKRAFCRPPVSEKHCKRTFLTENMFLWTATKICFFQATTVILVPEPPGRAVQGYMGVNKV